MSQSTVQTLSGAPDPRRALPHRSLLDANDPTAATLASGVAKSWVVPIAGSPRARLKWLSTCAGTLAFALLRPDGRTAYTTGNPANVVITAGTEADAIIDPLYGEGRLRITFTPSANGTVTYIDFCAL